MCEGRGGTPGGIEMKIKEGSFMVRAGIGQGKKTPRGRKGVRTSREMEQNERRKEGVQAVQEEGDIGGINGGEPVSGKGVTAEKSGITLVD